MSLYTTTSLRTWKRGEGELASAAVPTRPRWLGESLCRPRSDAYPALNAIITRYTLLGRAMHSSHVCLDKILVFAATMSRFH